MSEEDTNSKSTGHSHDFLSYEIVTGGDGTRRGFIRIKAVPVLIQITDGERVVQTKKLIVPGDIYSFAQRLEFWAETLIQDNLPEVRSEAFEGFGA